MTDQTVAGPRAPWHLWPVSGVGLLWNGFGAYDYLMTQTQGEAYLRGMGMTDAQVGYFFGLPAWLTVPWAIGVWCAVLGTVLLLMRMALAAPTFAASLAGLLVSLVYTYGLSEGGEAMGASGLVMNLVILAGCLFFVWYAWSMRKAGVLR